MTVLKNAVRTASRAGSKRAMMSTESTGPRMHKAKDAWKEIQATRPPEGHPHLVFHPPYNKATVAFGVLSVLTLGYGSMYSGMRHQQYKAGYWK
mmetsp:Transcript_15536/g.19714  ORF Transcript_15536/g.19714 Transcript_15536/m.19714 type:complete len:94 (-) Transcript_15536:334-615(-)|eukprot:CAMPEP_0203634518 /NCGR_PEP_ID=MMETSP0088-20131115/1433_1 /ASSEMBLY_ACC=CAM_ASM_001087 /TAXON_ID=426623 /ORGANISM="Chaetoceros affinis, Strain CCMP159" /LENGTH=93 /DNA_ID=CAMNT_0050488137 /DNA_START=34 /DNA_END=315 /DNA_ORIENTATION=+